MRVLTEGILAAVLAGAARQERPVVVFVAGQADSGKTLVVDLVHAALAARGGAVRVDRDACEAVHPDYPRFLAEDARLVGVLAALRVRGLHRHQRPCGWRILR
ncbi:zeta toxin family protein [Kitasatospora sp. NPDC004723]|uniref:zeta toxin family protein n=1 Tax=Kitasatospora sp. NPDC004723 TaxID=3154288 RepID=UPI0033B9D64D